MKAVILSLVSLKMKDFYSHSNWVEIGHKFPNTNLIKANAPVGNIAGKDMMILAVRCVW